MYWKVKETMEPYSLTIKDAAKHLAYQSKRKVLLWASEIPENGRSAGGKYSLIRSNLIFPLVLFDGINAVVEVYLFQPSINNLSKRMSPRNFPAVFDFELAKS